MLPPVRCLCRCCLWNVGARAWLTSGRVLTSLLVATATVRRCSMTFTLPSPVSASVVWDPPPPWHACHFFCCRLCVVVAGSVVCCDAAPSQMPLPLLFVECGSESLVDLGRVLTSLLVATATVRRCSMTFTLPSPVSASVVWDPPPPWHACHFFCCRLCVVVAGSVVCCDAGPRQMPLPLLFVGARALLTAGES